MPDAQRRRSVVEELCCGPRSAEFRARLSLCAVHFGFSAEVACGHAGFDHPTYYILRIHFQDWRLGILPNVEIFDLRFGDLATLSQWACSRWRHKIVT